MSFEGLEAEMAAQLATEGVYAPTPSMEEAMEAMSKLAAEADAPDADASALSTHAGSGAGVSVGARAPAGTPIDAKLLRTFVSLYCCYFNAALNERKGRRLPVSACVINPHPYDLAEAAVSLGLNVAIESKRHPCDPWSMGRVRVQLKLPSGSLAVPEIVSKNALMQRIAALLPDLPGRKARTAEYERYREEGLRRQAAAAKGQTPKAIAKAPAAGAGVSAAKKRKG